MRKWTAKAFLLPFFLLAFSIPDVFPGQAGQPSTQTLPDGTKVTTNQDGSVTSQYLDGTKSMQNTDGSKTIEEQNGTKTTYKPDGTRTTDYPPALNKKPEEDKPIATKKRKDGGTDYHYMDGRTAKFKGNGDFEIEERGAQGKKSAEYKKDGTRVVKVPQGQPGVGFRADTTSQVPQFPLSVALGSTLPLHDTVILLAPRPPIDAEQLVSGDNLPAWNPPTDAPGPISAPLGSANRLFMQPVPRNLNIYVGSGWSQSLVPEYFLEDSGVTARRDVEPCTPPGSIPIQDLQPGEYTLVTDAKRAVKNGFVPRNPLPDERVQRFKIRYERNGGYMIDASSGYNCHGFTFDRGDSEVESVADILADNYVEVPLDQAQVGDVIVYSVNGNIDHTGIVVDVQNGRPVMGASKLNASAPLFVHRPEIYAPEYKLYRRKIDKLPKEKQEKIKELRQAHDKAVRDGADERTRHQKAMDLSREQNSLTRVGKPM